MRETPKTSIVTVQHMLKSAKGLNKEFRDLRRPIFYNSVLLSLRDNRNQGSGTELTMEVFTTEKNGFPVGPDHSPRPPAPHPLIYLYAEILLPYLPVFLEKEMHERHHNSGVMKTCHSVSSVCQHAKGSSAVCSESNPDEAESGLSPCTSCLRCSSEPFSVRPPTELPFFCFHWRP